MRITDCNKPTVALVLNRKVDHTGTHRANCAQLKMYLQLLGYKVDLFIILTRDDLDKYVKSLMRKQYQFVHCEQGHFLSLKLNNENIYDKLGVKVFSQIRDHWFYPWLYPNLKSVPRICTLFHTSEMFKNCLYECGEHLQATHTSQLVRTHPKKLESKPVIYYAGTCRDINELNLVPRTDHEVSLLRRLKEEAEGACEMPSWIWDVTDKEAEAGFFVLQGNQLSPVFFYQLFEYGRTIIRTNILNVLSQFEASIDVKGGWKPHPKSKCRFRDIAINFPEANHLYASARFVFSDQATFAKELGERVVTALDQGQQVIMRKAHNSELANRVGTGISEYESLSDLRNILRSLPSLESIKENHKCQQFSIINYVEELIRR